MAREQRRLQDSLGKLSRVQEAEEVSLPFFNLSFRASSLHFSLENCAARAHECTSTRMHTCTPP